MVLYALGLHRVFIYVVQAGKYEVVRLFTVNNEKSPAITGNISELRHYTYSSFKKQQIDKEINNIDISKDQPIYLYCRSGNRSGKAAVMLEKIGFTNVINAGGIDEAAKKLEKKIVKYSE